MDFLKNKEVWARVRTSPQYKPLLDTLQKEYDEFCKDREAPVIKFSDEMEFIEKGTRAQFEGKYFLIRRRLTVYALLSLIYPENEEYFEELQNTVCAICNEYSWQVPAHRSKTNPNRRDGIALFSAETGLYLAEIKYIFSDRLNPLVTERITHELDWRILTSFENERTGIEIKSVTNNWASVLGCTIGLTFMYESPERFEKIFDRIERHMELYLEGISDDGGTPEGANYWNYGFGFYEMYYDTLRRHFPDKADGLHREKAKKLADFFPSVLLCRDSAVSFSDASPNAECNIWLAYFLNKEYGAPLPPLERLDFDSKEFSPVLRAFLYYEKTGNAEITEGEKHFEKLEWYIKRGKRYAFAVKGGKNDIEDNHNHNDIGSFILVHNNRQILCDLGSPQYTANNFGETRYEVLNNSSLGHSVPIVNGKAQGVGDGFYGKLTVGDKISVDMKNAYGDGIKKLERSFDLAENGLTLTDEFDFGLDIKERLVTDIKPQIKDGLLIIDKTRLAIPSGWSISLSERETTYHSGEKRKVFLIDFVPDADTSAFELKITFE